MALAPFVGWLHHLPTGADGAGRALRGGALLGAVHFGILLHWITPALLPLTPLAPLVHLAAVGVLALLSAGVARVVHALRHRCRVSVYVGFPLAWTAGEWLRGAAGDLAFPWLGLGVALAPAPALAGGAELVGSIGLGLWIGGVNSAVAAVAAWGSSGSSSWSRARMATVGVVLILPAIWGFARDATLETRDVGTLAAARTDLPREVVGDSGARERLGMAALRHGARALEEEARDVELAVWPETLVPERVAGGPERERELAALARRAGVPFLVGGYVPVGSAGPEGNGLALFDAASSSSPVYTYAKRRLVPGVEAAPFVGPEKGVGGLAQGMGDPVGRVGSILFGPLICYESAFSGVARVARRDGAHVLINATNDAWFGGGGWLGGRAGLEQHPPHLVLRAIETRAGVVRSAQVGPAFFVDPHGRVHSGTVLDGGGSPDHGVRLRVADVRTTETRTLHTRAGDWVGWGSAALLLVMLALPLGKGRSRRESAG